jgi:hypothetical protein
MESFIAGIVVGLCFGISLAGIYLLHYYFLFDKRKIDEAYLRMWNDGQGYFSLSFVINPPKPDLHKPAPKKAKLTLIKETEND